MGDSVKSLKKSNSELKRQLSEAKKDLKNLERRVTEQERSSRNENDTSRSEITLNREAEESLVFLGAEYDTVKQDLERISCALNNIEEKLQEIESMVDDFQEYSYSFNVKILGMPEQSDSSVETANETSNLCVKLFNNMGASVSISDIDLAHRVPLRNSSRGSPKPIVCKFTRRLKRNEVMSFRRIASEVNATDLGFTTGADLSVRVVDHFVSKCIQKSNNIL